MKDAVTTLKAKLAEWRSWMDIEKSDSIAYQMYRMLWDDMVFRIVNECRALAPPAAEGGVQLSGLLHEFINICYFQTQALAIRRLTEKNPIHPKKSVNSLRRLLDDIKEHRELYTRANIFAAEGLPYDYSAQKREYDEDTVKKFEMATAQGRRTFTTDNKLWAAWRIPEDLHKDFDRLSGTDEHTRSEGDVIRSDIITRLLGSLGVCAHIKGFVNKQVAHTADPRNAPQVHRINLQRIWDCHKAICQVASFVAIRILRCYSPCGLPVPQYNQFEHIENPLIKVEHIEKLRQLWHERENELGKWADPEWLVCHD